MDLSADQIQAMDALSKSIRSGARVSVLRGPAGTGKTTLMRAFSEKMREDGWYVFWAAPTGKAASRISQVTGEPASTLHSLLYRRVTEGRKGQPLFGDRRQTLIDGRKGLLVIDEASMVGKRLFDDLVAAAGTTVSLLFVGDREQVEPVADPLGPDLDNPTAELTTVHRQALESPILLVATEVRSGQRMRQGIVGDQYERRRGSAMEASEWICERLQGNRDAVVLCATNTVRRAVNKLARQELGFSAPICPGEQLVVGLNNKDMGKMNGETLRVEAVSPVVDEEGEESGLYRVFADGEVYFVHGPSIGEEVMDFKKAQRSRVGLLRNTTQWLHVDYGYALTIHRSQGSEWAEVCFLVDSKLKFRAGLDPTHVRRIAYTAITRAKKSLLILDV